MDARSGKEVAEPAVSFKRILELIPGSPEPVLTIVPILSKPIIKDVIMVAAALPYLSPEEDLFHPDHVFDGMSFIEVIIRKKLHAAAATGDLDQGEKVLDRLIDRPKQNSESVTVTTSYESWLKKLAEDEVQRRDSIPAEEVLNNGLEGFE